MGRGGGESWSPEQLRNEGGWLFDFAPIRHVYLKNADDVPVSDLIACPYLDWIKGLSMSSERAFEEDDLLANCLESRAGNG